MIEARDKAFANRKQLIAGIDPLAEKNTYKPRRVTTFKEVAEDAIARFAKAWTGPKQEPQWRSSLERYAYPILGQMHVGAITPEHVRDVLELIWVSKTPTAERVQTRIERILDFATVQKLRTGDNPARLKGNLEHLLGTAEKTEKHFPALPHSELVAFMGALRQREGMMARAHEFPILTATRTSEAAKATWSEMDFENAVWTIPAARTASVASLVAAPGMAAYVVAKHGVGGLTKAAALDLIGHGIRVNAICPGFVDTPMLAGALTTAEAHARIGALAPIGWIASAEEVARTALFLASDEASYLVGALLSVDGGIVAQ